MWGVVHEAGGTARRAKIDDIAVCGKTGTAENIGEDHSVFICFAPMNNPKIAVAVYIENARGGGGIGFFIEFLAAEDEIGRAHV